MWVSRKKQCMMWVKCKQMVRSFKPAVFQTVPLYQDNLSDKIGSKFPNSANKMKRILNENVFVEDDNMTPEYFEKFKQVVRKTEKNMRRRKNIYDAMGQEHFDEEQVDQFLKQDRESEVKSVFVDLIDQKDIQEAEKKLSEMMEGQDEKGQNSEYIERFNELIMVLGTKDEQQLMKIHGDCLAREKSSQFAEKAKGLILRQMVEIVQKQRKNIGQEVEEEDKKLLDRLLYDPNSGSEFMLSEIQGIDENMKLEQYLSDRIDQKSVEKVSEQLARQELEQQADQFVEYKQQYRRNQSEQVGEIDTKYSYLMHDNLLEIDPVYDPDMTFDDSNEFKYEYGMKQIEMSSKLRDYSDEQQQIYQIYQRIIKRYFEQKANIIQKEVMSRGMIRLGNLSDQIQEIKEIKHDYFKDFGIAENYLQTNMNVIRDLKQPNMSEIYDSIDYLVEGIHQNDFIKAKIERDDLYRNTEFKPTFSHLNISGSDLLWSQFKDTFDTVNSREYLRYDFDDLEYVHQYEEIAEDLNQSFNPQFMRFALDRSDKLFEDEIYIKQQDYNIVQSDDQDISDDDNNDDVEFNEGDGEGQSSSRAKLNLGDSANRMKNADVTKEYVKMDYQSAQSINLPYQDQYELEVYKELKRDQFFKHHLQQDLQYYSERNERIGHKISRNYISQYQAEKVYQIAQEKYDKIFDVYNKDQNMGRDKNQGKQRQGIGRGRRKTSSAVVIVRDGYGRVQINGKPFLQYFPDELQRSKCLIAIEVTRLAGLVDIQINVRSGGINGQVEAIQQGLARALCEFDSSLRKLIRISGLLYTDSRQVQRKRQGRYKARKSYTYVRR